MATSSEPVGVLHVDDDPAILETTAAFLERELDDPTVASHTSAEQALQRICEESFDCVVSDYQMPEMDGLELFEAVRAEGVQTPFILYTGKGSEEIASRALNTGVTGYFQKGGPDQQRRLANRVSQAVEEHRTREIADRYSTVLGALEYPIYVIDDEGRFEFVNEPFVEMTGYDRETIIGNTPDLIKSDSGVARAESELGSILSSEGPDTAQFEIEIYPEEGPPVPCRDHMAALPYEGASFRGSVGILRDISAERRREQELEFKTRAMDEAPVGITMSDPDRPDNPMVYINDRFQRLTGYDSEASLGRNCRFLQGDETDPETVARLRDAIDSGQQTSVTLRNYTKDGEPFWNRVTVAPIRDDDGSVARWVGFQQDVTERREYREQLERQNERLKEFASVVSHDLRNPIQLAQGRLELLREEADSEHAASIADALDRMERLVGGVLRFAREGHRVEETEVVDLVDAAEAAWGVVSDTGDARLAFETGGAAALRADPDRLGQLLQNLLDNALDHGGDTVTVGGLDGGFYVEDNGPGIPDDERDSVFEAGYSTDRDGTGFGLSIVKQVADAHGWEVRVTEGADGGARFEITGVDAAAE